MAATPVFPAQLPGFSIDVQREPTADVTIATASSGAEIRSSWQSVPRYKYQVTFELLRGTAAHSEAQTAWDHFTRSFGQLYAFLFTDPDDNTVTNHGFGLGTGAATAFQLQRRIVGPLYDRLGGPWLPSTVARTNSVQYSQALASSPWTASGSLTVTNNVAVAPDGTITGSSLVATASAGTSQALGAISTAGPATFSVWVQSAAGASIALTVTDTTASTTIATSTTAVTAGGGWQRLSVTGTLTAGHNITVTIATVGAGTFSAWGAQFEPGSVTATQYIATTSASTTAAPSYWPAGGDGFEPIYDINPSGSAFGIYVNGTLQTPGTAYSLSATGVVTFATAPTANAKLTWSGSYFRRVRFADASIKYDRIVTNWYGAKQINLLSVLA